MDEDADPRMQLQSQGGSIMLAEFLVLHIRKAARCPFMQVSQFPTGLLWGPVFCVEKSEVA